MKNKKILLGVIVITLLVTGRIALADTITVVSDVGINVYGPLDHYATVNSLDWGSPRPAVKAWIYPSWPKISGATWISTAEYVENPRYDSWRLFEDVIELPSYASNIRGNLTIVADNAEEVYLNGVLIGSYGEVQGPFNDDYEWKTILSYPLIGLKAGANRLKIIVRNYPQAGGTQTSNPTGLIYKAEITYDIVLKCEDGTPMGKCNTTDAIQPLYCNEKLELVSNCSHCGCKEHYFCNQQIEKCLPKGIGCYDDKNCINYYNSTEFKCMLSSASMPGPPASTPGHCCLKNEIWNGTHCTKRKLTLVLIPFGSSWNEMQIDPIGVVKEAMKNFPIPEENIEIIKWETPCNTIGSLVWFLCPNLVGAIGGDRYILIAPENRNLLGDCLHDAAGCTPLWSSVVLCKPHPLVIAHELGHSFGLRDEYCYSYFLKRCGVDEPNPLKEEYGCKPEPLCNCEYGSLRLEKSMAKKNEPIGVKIEGLKGECCDLYSAKIWKTKITSEEEIRPINKQALKTCSDYIKACDIAFSEEGTYVIEAQLIGRDHTLNVGSQILVIQGEGEPYNYTASSCEEAKNKRTVDDVMGLKPGYYKYSAQSTKTIKGELSIFDENCNKVVDISGKYEIRPGTYIIKCPKWYCILDQLSDFFNLLESKGLCCWKKNVYEPTCLGNKGKFGGRSIMSTNPFSFSEPAWNHLEKIFTDWGLR